MQCSYTCITISFINVAASLPTTNTIYISEVAEGQVYFEWNPVITGCPAVHYEVNTTECGTCSANVTLTPNISCNMLLTRQPKCAINVTTKSNVCGNALEAVSYLKIQLKEGRLIAKTLKFPSEEWCRKHYTVQGKFLPVSDENVPYTVHFLLHNMQYYFSRGY